MSDAAERRERMVEEQLAARGIEDAALLAAFREVPREEFVGAEYAAQAYDDGPLPIQAGQTISQPYVVALMLEALELTPGDRVLEVGTGSGYAAAILSRVVREVYTIERHSELAELARERLERLGCSNAHVRCGDGTLGWPEHAPYDAIVAAAGGPEVPAPLQEQLAEGGRLVMPVGTDPTSQSLVRLVRHAGDWQREDLGGVRFVPLVGAEGWAEGGDGGSRPRRPLLRRLGLG